MVENGDTGDIACDHYRRWAEDVAQRPMPKASARFYSDVMRSNGAALADDRGDRG